MDQIKEFYHPSSLKPLNFRENFGKLSENEMKNNNEQQSALEVLPIIDNIENFNKKRGKKHCKS